MDPKKPVITLLALLLASVTIGPCVSAEENVTAGNGSPIIIHLSITNNAQGASGLNGTIQREIKPLNSVPVSNLKKIPVPGPVNASETHQGGFTDRDWAFIRKSMTDLSQKEQDLFIIEMKKVLSNTSALSPGEQANLSIRMGYYLNNATHGGKPVDPSDLPGLPAEKPVQTSAAILPATPLIAVGVLGIIRRWWISLLPGQ